MMGHPKNGVISTPPQYMDRILRSLLLQDDLDETVLDIYMHTDQSPLKAP